MVLHHKSKTCPCFSYKKIAADRMYKLDFVLVFFISYLLPVPYFVRYAVKQYLIENIIISVIFKNGEVSNISVSQDNHIELRKLFGEDSKLFDK